MTDVFTLDPAAATTLVAETPPAPKTVDDRLKDKDDFIEQLKQETKRLRDELNNKLDAEQALEELRNELKSLKAVQQQSVKDGTPSALSEVDIRTLVQKTITEREANSSKEQNIKQANDNLVASLGGDVKKAAEEVQKRAKELGVSVQFLKDAAAQSPTAFIKLIGGDKSSNSDDGTFVQSTVNSTALGNENKVVLREGTKAYFDNVRKSDPKKYWTPDVQNQLWKAVKAGTYQLTEG